MPLVEGSYTAVITCVNCTDDNVISEMVANIYAPCKQITDFNADQIQWFFLNYPWVLTLFGLVVVIVIEIVYKIVKKKFTPKPWLIMLVTNPVSSIFFGRIFLNYDV